MGLFSGKAMFKPTGNAGDDQLLTLLSKAPGGLAAERHWIHYIYCSDDTGAAELEAQAISAGWTVRRVAEPYQGIVAERTAVIDSASVRSTREFFEGLAAAVSAGEYDGWEASAG